MVYPKWWDHNRDLQKRNPKKTFIAVVAQIKAKNEVVKRVSALATTINIGGKVLNMSVPI